jgi:Fe-S-cluster containining protein
MTVISLQQSYTSIRGLPVIDRVDPTIFIARYYRDCMGCRFCADLCCSYGAELDPLNADRILAAGDELVDVIGHPTDRWFVQVPSDDPVEPDALILRSSVQNGRCVFLDRAGRGCKLHSFSSQRGRDGNDLKPMICALFPVTYDYGLLRPSYEIQARELICMGPGDTLYAGARADLGYYFGSELLIELDGLAAQVAAASAIAAAQ